MFSVQDRLLWDRRREQPSSEKERSTSERRVRDGGRGGGGGPGGGFREICPRSAAPGRGVEAGPELAGARQPPTARGSSPHLQNPQGGKLNSSMKAQIHLLDELITANY